MDLFAGVDVVQSDVLDVVIGVVFVWFLFSSVLFAVNEGLVWVTHIRSKYLWLALGRMLDPQQSKLPRRLLDISWRLPFSFFTKTGNLDRRPLAPAEDSSTSMTIVDRLNTWNNKTDQRASVPLLGPLQNLYDALQPRLNEIAKGGNRTKVTDIPGDVFAEAIATIAAHVRCSDLAEAAKEDSEGKTPTWSADEVLELRQKLGLDVPAGDAREEVEAREAAEDREVTVEEVASLSVGTKTATDLRRLYIDASRDLSGRDVADFFRDNPDLAEWVRNAAASVGRSETAIEVKKAVATWFDREMEQASAHYRRQSRKILGVLAIPVVVFLQANVFGIVADLRADTALRQAVVTEAVAAANQDDLAKAITHECKREATSSTTSGTARDDTETPPGTDPDPFDAAVERFQCAGTLINSSSSFRLLPDVDQVRLLHDEDDVQNLEPLTIRDWWEYVIVDWGWLGRAVTLAALLFGAQFWYDVLRRLIGIRTVLTKAGAAAG